MSQDEVDPYSIKNPVGMEAVNLYFNPAKNIQKLEMLIMTERLRESEIENSSYHSFYNRGSSLEEEKENTLGQSKMHKFLSAPTTINFDAREEKKELEVDMYGSSSDDDCPPPMGGLSLHRSVTILPSDDNMKGESSEFKEKKFVHEKMKSPPSHTLPPPSSHTPSPSHYFATSTSSNQMEGVGSIEMFYSSVYSVHMNAHRYNDVIDATAGISVM
jgi:hypothetical protein